MTMTLPEPTGVQVLPPVHEPTGDKGPKTRYPLLFWQRAKILVGLSVMFVMVVAIRHEEIPTESWTWTAREQARSKWWIFALMGVEVVRQIHFLLAENYASYHGFWEKNVWGAWDKQMSRLSPWARYRAGRIFKVLGVLAIALVIFSRVWGVSLVEAIAQAPGRLWTNPLGNAGVPWFLQLFFGLFYVLFQFIGIFWFMSKGGVDTYMPQEIKTRFSDVWGQDKVLDKVQENIVFLDKPEEIESKGGHVPSGILLWGPPGTGKTLMAEAVAGETGRPYVFVDPGAFQAMFMGVGIMKVKSLFRKLRKLALRNGGVIVFFDEADSLGSRGGAVAARNPMRDQFDSGLHQCNGMHYNSSQTAQDFFRDELRGATAAQSERPSRFGIIMGGMGGGGGGMGTLQALLTELSGLKKPRGIITRRLRAFLNMRPKQPPKYRILVMMATNLPDALDDALLRPGRIDRMYKVDYPNLEGRIRTFNGYFDKVKHALTPEHVERLATMSPRASGAVIKDIVNESLIVAIRNGRDTVLWPDVLEAKAFKVHGLADGVAPTTLEQHETAIHEAAHAVATYLLKRRDVIDIATIEQRGSVGGFVSWVPIEERKFDWRTEIENDVISALASLAGERIFFGGDNSVGVGGDLRASTAMVRRMLSRAAMGGTITSHVTDPSLQGLGSTNDDLSPGSRNAFDAQVEAKLQELYQRAYKLIFDNRWFLVSIAHALQAHRTISGEDIDAIYRGRPGPTLDGSVYHTEAFRNLMGPYLEQARSAHRDQTSVSLDLPLFTQPDVALRTPANLMPAVAGPPAHLPQPGNALPPMAIPPGYAGSPPPVAQPPGTANGGWPTQPPRAAGPPPPPPR